MWEKEKLWGKVEQAERVRRSGEVMLATELRAARTYWHVTQSAFQGAVKIYPASYTSFVIGILWQMMAQVGQMPTVFVVAAMCGCFSHVPPCSVSNLVWQSTLSHVRHSTDSFDSDFGSS